MPTSKGDTLITSPKLSPFACLQVLRLLILPNPIPLLWSKSLALSVAPICLLAIASYRASQTQLGEAMAIVYPTEVRADGLLPHLRLPHFILWAQSWLFQSSGTKEELCPLLLRTAPTSTLHKATGALGRMEDLKRKIK